MVAQARRLLTRRATIYSDCLNVVRSATGPIQRALAPGRAYAGICLDKLQMADNDKLVEDVVWVKSHRTLAADADSLTARNIRGNAEADRLAKAAIDAHPSPTPLQRASLDFYVKRAQHVAVAIATALARFPAAEPVRLTRARPPRDREDAERRQVHWWSYDEDNWRCRICGKWATCQRLEPRHRAEKCHGPKAEAEAKTWVGWGHRISMAKGAVSIAFCTKCGAWGNRRALKLRAACAAPTAAGVAALKNIAAGKHPWQRKLPQGGSAPRSRLRVVATYVEDRDAWAPAAADTITEDIPINIASSDIGPDPAPVAGDAPQHDTVDHSLPICNVPSPPECDDCDPFGHGGSLDTHTDDDHANRRTVSARDSGNVVLSLVRERAEVGQSDASAVKKPRISLQLAADNGASSSTDTIQSNGETLGTSPVGSISSERPPAVGPSGRDRIAAVRERLRAKFASSTNNIDRSDSKHGEVHGPHIGNAYADGPSATGHRVASPSVEPACKVPRRHGDGAPNSFDSRSNRDGHQAGASTEDRDLPERPNAECTTNTFPGGSRKELLQALANAGERLGEAHGHGERMLSIDIPSSGRNRDATAQCVASEVSRNPLALQSNDGDRCKKRINVDTLSIDAYRSDDHARPPRRPRCGSSPPPRGLRAVELPPRACPLWAGVAERGAAAVSPWGGRYCGRCR